MPASKPRDGVRLAYYLDHLRDELVHCHVAHEHGYPFLKGSDRTRGEGMGGGVSENCGMNCQEENVPGCTSQSITAVSFLAYQRKKEKKRPRDRKKEESGRARKGERCWRSRRTDW